MARRFRRRRSFNARRARSFVRRTVADMGTILRKTVLLEGLAVPNRTTNPYDTPLAVSLLECTEAQNEETTSDGTNIADCPLYSKLVALKLNLNWHGMASSVALRWMLYKSPDNDISITSLEGAQFHNTTDSQSQRDVRANTLAKGWIVPQADSLKGRIPIFIKRQTLKRLGTFRENDTLKLAFAGSGASSNGSITGFGTLYVKAK